MKIGLFDHMGYGNLGDAATQDVLIANIRKRLPEATLVGFSLDPDDTTKRHGISCHPIKWWYPQPIASDAADESTLGSGRRRGGKALLLGLPAIGPALTKARHLQLELTHLRKSFLAVKSLDCLILSGGGQLGDLWHGPWSHPYNILKFAILAKVTRTKLVFVNVGAGPLRSRLSRRFIRRAVLQADYLSFRDKESEALIRGLGVNVPANVFPDSVYAYDTPKFNIQDSGPRPLVGLNPIGFSDPRLWPEPDAAAYSRYLDKIADFSVWLLARNYRLQVFSTELSVDARAIADLRHCLSSRLPAQAVDEIFAPVVRDVPELLNQMSRFDFVVTSKFHGVVFAHLLEKPLVALSYHPKIDDLIRAVGHSECCLDIATFDESRLRAAFESMVREAENLKARFRRTTAMYEKRLQTQFDELFVPSTLMRESPDAQMSRLPGAEEEENLKGRTSPA